MTYRVFVSLIACAAVAQTAADGPAAPVQPLPFSHRLHTSKGLSCKDCHAMPDPGDEAGFPATSKCMACHATIAKDRPAIARLAEFYKKQEPIPWKRVYRVPDYVSFSHKTHVLKAQAACETCHGPVQERDAIRKEKSISMAACIDCHAGNRASVACDYCHERR
jgi:hypothetical protein